MKKYKFLLGCALAALALSSCNNYDFDQNFYPHKVGLMAGTNRIYDRTTVKLSAVEQGTASVKLVALLSGSQMPDRDYHVTVAHDDSLFNAYNKSNFDIDSTKFAKLLPEDCYEDVSLTGTIPSGSNKCYFDIKLKNLDKLSPDSTYFLDYKIVSHDAEGLATDNNNLGEALDHVLIKVTYENDWASTATTMSYRLTSATVTDIDSKKDSRPTNDVRAFPLSANSVRFLAGDEKYDDYKTALHDINVRSMVITVGKQTATNPSAYYVTLTPYMKDSLEMEMLTPVEDYDNTFAYTTIGGGSAQVATYYKEFRLHYKYRVMKDKKDSQGNYTAGPWKEVKCKMRYQYNPRADEL